MHAQHDPMATNNQSDQQSTRTRQEERLYVQMANYAQLAVVFPAATLIGWLIGSAFDRWLRHHVDIHRPDP
jgi:hypothetical protein